MEFHLFLKDLDQFASRFWTLAGNSKVFAFHGQMGAGKTTLIGALCHQKGTHDVTGSPTFSIINQYESGTGEKIYHIDLYRLNSEEEVAGAGVEDCVFSGDICLVEWPEKAPWLFDENTVHVYLEPVSENERLVRVEGGTELKKVEGS